MKKLTLLRLKDAFWFGMMFATNGVWGVLLCSLVGKLFGLGFWWPALFGVAVASLLVFMAIVIPILFDWGHYRNEEKCLHAIATWKEEITRSSLGLIRFMK